MADDLSIGKLFVELLVNDTKYGPALRKAAADLDALKTKTRTAGREAGAAIAPLATAFQAVTDAEKQHIATIIASEAAEKQRAAAIGVSVAQLRQMEAALKSEAAAEKARNAAVLSALKPTTDGVAKLATANNAAASAAGNLRFQLFDVVQQASAGQNPLMILNQQGFQIVQAFGMAGGAGAMQTFTAALGPLGPMFTAVVAAAGPLSIVLAGLVTAYAVLANEAGDIDEATTGAAESAVSAAKKIAGTADDIEKANEAWKKFRETTEDLSIELAIQDGTLTKTEAKTIERTKRVRAEADLGIRSAGAQLAATQTTLQAMEKLVSTAPVNNYDRIAGSEARAEAEKAIPILREQLTTQQKVLDERKKALDDTIGLVLTLGAAEADADEDKDGKKDKAKATKEQTAALRDYDAAMRDLAKTTDAAAGAAALQRAEDQGGSSPIERTFQRSMEQSRQKADDQTQEIEAKLNDALAAADTIGGDLGAKMAAEARAAFAQAQGAVLGQFVEMQDEAARVADKAVRDAATKRVAASREAISIQVDDEKEYAATLSAIREAYVERYGELVRVEVDYARLTADERLAVEQKIQSEMDDLRQQAADAEIARQKNILAAYRTAGKSMLSQAASVVADIQSFQQDQIASIDERLEASAEARRRRAAGEVLTEKEKDAILTQSERERLEAQKAQFAEAATATFAMQKAFSIVSIGMNTATAIMQVMATLPAPANFVAAGVVAAMGATQAALVMAQEPPEYHVGGVVGQDDRRRSPGRSTSRAVMAELEVGEGVLVGRAVRALGGHDSIARLNADPVGAMSSIAAHVQGTAGARRSNPIRFDARSVSPASLPMSGGSGRPNSIGAEGRAESNRPIVVVSKIGERTFDSIMATGLGGARLPKVRSRLQRMTGVTVGLDG